VRRDEKQSVMTSQLKNPSGSERGKADYSLQPKVSLPRYKTTDVKYLIESRQAEPLDDTFKKKF